mmetsp:Transcript_22467/g.32099  ORF Transcript_22467/g.32099 Transcript_22467/m.32099 type:complete len:607 (+) Transcript_22467:202-2022(+)
MMGPGHDDVAVSTNIATARACTHPEKFCRNRISFNDSESNTNLSSSLPVKKRFKSANDQPSAVFLDPGLKAFPGINDVLLGKGPTCFDHIGNRRFRILVEVNVDNYFDSDITALKVEDTSSKKTSKQDEIINNVLSSIQGNSPSGRFLLPMGKADNSCSSNVVSSLDEISWEVASEEEARQKVHVTFLAAGRFFIKRDHIFDMIKRASQVDEDDGDLLFAQQSDDDRSAGQSKVDSGCTNDQTKDVRACQAVAKIADTMIISNDDAAGIMDGKWGCQHDDRGPRNDSGRSAISVNTVSANSTPFTLNLNQPIHTSISQQLCYTNGLVYNYIPSMVSTFQSIPIEEFFMPDERDNPSSAEAITHPAAYIIPSNYDVLCGSGQAFFHHIGNRRFRIMIEMNIERYEKEYQKVGRGENFSIHEIVAQINKSIASRCPPGRFLAMDMQTGWWRVLSPMYSQLKVEQTLFQCMQVKQRAEEQAEKQRIVDLAIEAAKQKDQITAAMKAASSFYDNKVEAGSYKPRRKRQKSTALPNGQDKSNIFFPSVLGDKDEFMKAQEYAKKSLKRKSATLNPSNDNEGLDDSQDADDKSCVLDAVSGMITLSRRGSST